MATIPNLSADNPDRHKQFKVIDRRYDEGQGPHDEMSNSEPDTDDDRSAEPEDERVIQEEDETIDADDSVGIHGDWYYRLGAEPGKRARDIAALSLWHESQLEYITGSIENVNTSGQRM